MVDEIYFRLANIEDCGQIYRVHTGSIKGVCAKHGNYSKDQIELWVSRQSVDRYEDPVNRGRLIVACQRSDDVIVGFGHYEFVAEGVMEIKALYVSSDSVGHGIGGLFMKEFNRVSDEHGDVKKMVVASTANAVQFYEKHGFVSEGETVHCTRGCVSINCIKMSKNYAIPH